MARDRWFPGAGWPPKLAIAGALLVFVWALAFSFAAEADSIAGAGGLSRSDDETAFDDLIDDAIAVAVVELGSAPAPTRWICSPTPPVSVRSHAASLDHPRAPPLD